MNDIDAELRINNSYKQGALEELKFIRKNILNEKFNIHYYIGKRIWELEGELKTK
jgi:hypothetical protein